MNEIDILNRWERPATDPHAMAEARAALDAVMVPDAMGVVTTVRPARRRLAARALIAAAVTIVLATGAVVVLQRQVDDRIDRIHRAALPAGTLDASKVQYPMTILVVGSDSRAFVDNATQAQAFGSSTNVPGQRADTVILVRLTATTTTAVWLPRALLFEDHGTTRRLSSYLQHGPPDVIAAIRDNLHVDVNHYVEVDFKAFIKVVDAIGGVRMDVHAPIRDAFTGLNIPTPGCTVFDGNESLAWVRSRHLESRDLDGRWHDQSVAADLDRATRQQDFVRALVAKLHAEVGSDVAAAERIADSVVPSLVVDSQWGRDDIRGLVRRIARDDPSTWNLRTIGVQMSKGDVNRLTVDGPVGEELFAPPAPVRGPRLGPDNSAPVVAGAPCRAASS